MSSLLPLTQKHAFGDREADWGSDTRHFCDLFSADERRLVAQRYALFARVMRQDLKQLDSDLEACFHHEMVNVVLGGHDDEETMAA